ncbi:hypothetical protein SAMN00017405_0169 [Desulfonispora thiosulfatigenes DSM 11270]|uniref:Pyridoxal phosphate homeostasis protein n=1 Tax=Desulfonispora thiosulfatigenes DSM 11270 TaxID=656914 RepID=A0A1W1VME8_DESTI|nr:hypothetical protein SAMN00017405_0169 [Desulfonispora thiosulfatigenes DSM 11270]
MDIIENFKKVNNNIANAIEKGNKGNKVSLIAVTKNHTIEEISNIVNQNHFLLGENRVQELLEKYDSLPEEVQWHLIGHLQKNKVKYITDKVKLIHSLDSYGLAKEINKRMKPLEKPMDCLVQVNIAEEESKFGLKIAETIPFIEEVSHLPFVRIKGLMTMAPYVENPEEVRPVFKEAYNIFQQVKEKNIPNVNMDTLSMGMTNDYQIAIEEGATIVRVGSAIFGPRSYN